MGGGGFSNVGDTSEVTEEEVEGAKERGGKSTREGVYRAESGWGCRGGGAAAAAERGGWGGAEEKAEKEEAAVWGHEWGEFKGGAG